MLDLELANIPKNLAEIKLRIQENEVLFSREPHSVFLLAVSKGQPIEKIEAAMLAGQTAFGENHLQEALPKITALTGKKLEWHFIGLIQSNKTKKIAEHFSWVHSLTDRHIAKRLSEQRPPHLPPLNICLQVNLSQQQSKQGVPINQLEELINYCVGLPHLKIRGLMAIPVPKETFEAQRTEFAKLSALFYRLNENKHQLDTLSMGMSNDMKAAIAEGATIVRIGTAIFGTRTS
ncbi:MAG: hypothetical protein K0S27_693 [Gammaproteobacteria bacterium]|jgi:pyridoxal phosphate enzyme (YggS family)|nr:hypothetical protein [Gammaproteobacteria bacterium]